MSPTPADDRRLEGLVDTIVSLASGDLTARMAASPARDNIDAVITGINLLAGELEDIHADLEQRVLERTEQLEQARAELERLAMSDPLTGLANRNLLHERLEAAVNDRHRGFPPTVLLIDLDQFKTINDSLGHGAGDDVLVEVARRLQSLERPGSTVARLGGDEFAVLLADASPETAHDFAVKTLHALNAPFFVGGRTVTSGASVGLRIGDIDADGEMLLRDADTAMYAAKADGRGNVQVYHPSMHSAVQERLTIASDLAEAIAGDRLFLQYQPIVGLTDGVMVGAEALIRWRHPVRGILPPRDFVSVAESTGLIIDLGRWMITESISQLARWQRQYDIGGFQLNINLSPLELRRPDLDSFILQMLRSHQVDARRLVVELPETALMTTSPIGMKNLQVLREAGVGIAIDDFGTGYSSVSSLRELPIDTVKLDRSLIAGIDTGERERLFLAAVLQLIRSVELGAVVEGVETARQLRTLRDLDCGFGQGFHFAAPADPAALGAWMGAVPVTPRPATLTDAPH